MKNAIKTPRMFTGALVDDVMNFTIERTVGLQRTCRLVEEWSEKYQARIEKHDMAGQWQAPFFIRMRVAQWSEEAVRDAHAITKLVARVRRGSGVEITVKMLLENGYSQNAIDEVMNS